MVEEVEDLRPKARYLLPDEMREQMAQDFAPVVPDDDLANEFREGDVIVAVGDVVSMDLKKREINPRMFICDYKTHRDNESPEFEEELGNWGDNEIKVMNPSGTITRKAWSAIRKAMSRDDTTRILVNGEEDLLGIPAFLEAPIGAKVVYGSPGKGAVVVTISKSFKATVREILSKFEEE